MQQNMVQQNMAQQDMVQQNMAQQNMVQQPGYMPVPAIPTLHTVPTFDSWPPERNTS